MYAYKQNQFDLDCRYFSETGKKYSELTQEEQLELCLSFYKQYPGAQKIIAEHIDKYGIPMGAHFARDSAQFHNDIDKLFLDALGYVVKTEYNIFAKYHRG
jgi:hypothetical protein